MLAMYSILFTPRAAHRKEKLLEKRVHMSVLPTFSIGVDMLTNITCYTFLSVL